MLMCVTSCCTVDLLTLVLQRWLADSCFVAPGPSLGRMSPDEYGPKNAFLSSSTFSFGQCCGVVGLCTQGKGGCDCAHTKGWGCVWREVEIAKTRRENAV